MRQSNYRAGIQNAMRLDGVYAMRVLPAAGRQAKSLAAQLAHDRSGNVLILSAVAIIPILGMIGGAIDASRLYMARTRLQQACDAGALAGRKAMANITTLTTAEKALAKNFFDFNFPAGTYEATNVVANYVRGAQPGTVAGTASIVIPTTIMRLFGFETVPMSVTCESTLSIPNTDVMFVLDVTGSMLETPDGDTQTKIAGLKQAVKEFYAALGPGTSTGAGRVRYGFMPYSSNVNVGKIVYALNANYIAGGTGVEEVEYQTRKAVTTPIYIPTYGTESAPGGATTSQPSTGYTDWADTNAYVSGTSQADCNRKSLPTGNSTTNSTQSSGTRGTAAYPQNQVSTPYSSQQTTTQPEYRYDYRQGYVRSGRSWVFVQVCMEQIRTKTTTVTSNWNTTTPVSWATQEQFASWNYAVWPVDVSSVVQNGSANNPTYWTGLTNGGNPNINEGNVGTGNYYTTGTPSTITWDGCIEEAKTLNTITATSALTAPSGAYDLDIDLIPNSADTRWKPFLPAIQFRSDNRDWLGRQNGWIQQGFAVCPREASPLGQYASDYVATTKSSARFNTYVDSLTAVGGTYHDIGMIWGARFLSQDGIYAATNGDAAAPGGFQVSRHIVFMTDGTLDTRPNANDPWGINNLQGKIAPTGTNENGLEAIHRRRTSIICNEMKGKGFTIWVVGFGIDTMPTELQECATDAAHWTLAIDSAALRAEFQKIAQTIGGLRLSS
ncbi:TadE/TadG family type IV pilus assembly protein [Sphingomonas qomolangmaensis]|uniref:TadE/TadG family protein n=1 Tax=Sphingomonas qomolangmaensis TaxID=2918765 RepID=A0ABY5LF51_9SPHN|nr:TadE/TadG family type IV pilus assembly protein [Sphingomonas qomolangmaensis]UUL83341.1 TadE/TadG family protein [Sphingomonas qomolangmaensis]